MTRGKALLLLVALVVAWGGINWYRTDQGCGDAFPGQHATLTAVMAPHEWLPRDAILCRA